MAPNYPQTISWGKTICILHRAEKKEVQNTKTRIKADRLKYNTISFIDYIFLIFTDHSHNHSPPKRLKFALVIIPIYVFGATDERSLRGECCVMETVWLPNVANIDY